VRFTCRAKFRCPYAQNKAQHLTGTTTGRGIMSAMDEVKRVANRMTVALMSGLAGGATYAVLRGRPIGKSAIAVAANWAVISSTCFSVERVSNVALGFVMNEEDYISRLYLSHAIGGAVGGSVLGFLFHGRVVPGFLLFTPAMVMVAFGEIAFEEARKVRLEKLLDEIQPEEKS
jgi:hypothetical protein